MSTPNKSPRRRAREFALQGVYQWLLSQAQLTSIESQLGEVGGFDKCDRDLFLGLLRGTISNATLMVMYGNGRSRSSRIRRRKKRSSPVRGREASYNGSVLAGRLSMRGESYPFHALAPRFSHDRPTFAPV